MEDQQSKTPAEPRPRLQTEICGLKVWSEPKIGGNYTWSDYDLVGIRPSSIEPSDYANPSQASLDWTWILASKAEALELVEKVNRDHGLAFKHGLIQVDIPKFTLFILGVVLPRLSGV